MQPLDRVVCGLIKIVQRARRGRQLAANLQQWKQEQERIVGEALFNKRPHPDLTPWVPPKPTLLQGIYFYQKTHMEELQLEKTKNAIRQVFIDTGITPFEDGRWIVSVGWSPACVASPRRGYRREMMLFIGT